MKLPKTKESSNAEFFRDILVHFSVKPLTYNEHNNDKKQTGKQTHITYPGGGGGTQMSRGVSGLSKNSHKKGLLFHSWALYMRYVTWIGYQIHAKLA